MILRLNYAAHDAFIEPARATSAVWRLLIGLIIIAGLYLTFGRYFFHTLHLTTQVSNPSFVDDVFDGLRPLTLLILLATFGFLTLATVIVVRAFHQRSVLGLLGPMPLAIRQFVAAFAILLLLGAALLVLPPWGMDAPLTPNLAPGLWVVLLPLSIVAIFIQVSAEEVLFRGYIQQQLAARFRSPLIWMVLPAALFGMGHYQPDMAGTNAVLIAGWATVFGMLMADLTARAGSLGPAIALHFYNNISAILVVSMPDSLSGLSLFHAPFGLTNEAAVRAWLPVDLAHMLVAWLAVRLALRR